MNERKGIKARQHARWVSDRLSLLPVVRNGKEYFFSLVYDGERWRVEVNGAPVSQRVGDDTDWLRVSFGQNLYLSELISNKNMKVILEGFLSLLEARGEV